MPKGDFGLRKTEVRDQTSEVRVKLISDLRLLTSMIDDSNSLNDLPFTNDPMTQLTN